MVTKIDENWVPEWSQKVIKIEPLGLHGCFFLDGDCVRFWKDVFFDDFLVRQKGRQKSR